MASQSLPKDTWVDIKSSLSLSDNIAYTVQNIGSVRVLVNTETGSTPSDYSFIVYPSYNQEYTNVIQVSSGAGIGLWFKADGHIGTIGVEESV